jgi:alpha-L-fucosidase 2
MGLAVLAAWPVRAQGAHGKMGSPLQLWYDRPAKIAMDEALPVGNGRLGGLVFGGVAAERFAFNEDSLWTGDANPSGDYDSMGAYQAFGDLLIDLPGSDSPEDYRRDLDLRNAVASVRYTSHGVHFTREYFASHPAGVVAIRLTADKPGSYTGTIRLHDAHGASAVATEKGVAAAGKLSNGLRYESRLVVIPDSGTVQTAADGTVAFQGCNGITLLLAAGTDYAMDRAHGYRGVDPHARIVARLNAASARKYDDLKAEHIRDYRSLFDRVALDLGATPASRSDLPTDKRKVLAAAGGDPELEQLLFQYGRYLLISCSRPGSLPANLQGLWNDSNTPAWHSDYHANINIQMNYWLADPANLSECQLPFFDLVDSQLADWRVATANSPEYTRAGGAPVRGWALRTSHNITGGMGWNWDKTANAWYCQHYFEHYAFTGDRTFLRDRAYPILKETCEFWEDHLKALPDGTLVVPHAWSPEHGPTEDGVSYSQEIVWDLFTNYLDAGAALGIDAPYRSRIAALRERLATPKIGRWGQLQEWREDIDDPNDHHRHTSHLYGVYPGRQFSPAITPEKAAAAAKSLAARGDSGDVREWSFAWRTALWARLGDGERAYGQMLQLFADRNTCFNLFGLHPPMQIDGNFGVTAGIAEMLLQSDSGSIQLLPALPKAWPSGSVTGLRARGGFVVDESWAAGRLTSAVIHSTVGGTCRVRNGSASVEIRVPRGGATRLEGALAVQRNAASARDPK